MIETSSPYGKLILAVPAALAAIAAFDKPRACNLLTSVHGYAQTGRAKSEADKAKKGLTQEQFADISGFSQQYISLVESLARPAGNATGLVNESQALAGKQLEETAKWGKVVKLSGAKLD